MHRNEGSGNVNGSYTNGPPPTVISPAAMNALQEEIAYVIESTGAPLLQASNDTFTQLRTAIDSIVSSLLNQVNRFLKFFYNNVNRAVIEVESDGSLNTMNNVYESGSVIKLRTTGTATRIRQDFTTGAITEWYYTGAADDTITWTVRARGGISGNLIFNTTITPPKVSSGNRDCKGISYINATDTTLALATHNFMSSRAAFDTYQWYRVIQDSRDGTFRFIHSFDTTSLIITDNAISNIAVAGTTATITCASTAGLVAADGHVVVIKVTALGAGTMTNLIGRVTTVPDGTHFTVETSYAGTSPGAVTATYSAYFRIQTVQGGAASIIVDASVEVYTPTPTFCPELNGYYLDINGVPTSSATSAIYRILGVFYVHTGPLVEYMYSYKSGRDKADNYLYLETSSTRGATNTRIPIFTNITYAHGNDYLYATAAGPSATDGMSVTIGEYGEGDWDKEYTGCQTSVNTLIGISKNSNQLTTGIFNITKAHRIAFAGTSSASQSVQASCVTYDKKGDVIRAHLQLAENGDAAQHQFTMRKL